jgi:hypothetical protein
MPDPRATGSRAVDRLYGTDAWRALVAMVSEVWWGAADYGPEISEDVEIQLRRAVELDRQVSGA